MDQLGVVPLLAKGLHEGRDVDGADRELRGAGFQDEVAELGGGGTTVRGEYTVADALEEGLRGGGKMGGRARDSSARFLRGEGAVVGARAAGERGGEISRVGERKRRQIDSRTSAPPSSNSPSYSPLPKTTVRATLPTAPPTPCGCRVRGSDFGQTDSGTRGIRRARAVRRAREGGGDEGEVRARTLATFPNIADISVAAPRRARACYGSTAPRDAQRLPVNNTRGPIEALRPSGGERARHRAVGRNADSATGGGSPSQRGYCRPRDVYAGDVNGTRGFDEDERRRDERREPRVHVPAHPC